MRARGWSDAQILHAVTGCAHFNYLNRVADGLGIRLEYASDLRPIEVPTASSRPAGAPTGVTAPATGARGTPLPRVAVADPDPSGIPGLGALRETLEAFPDQRAGFDAWRAFQMRGTARLPRALRVHLLAHVARWLGGTPHAAYAARGAQEPGMRPGGGAHDPFLLEHARRITFEPWLCREEHVARLRELGHDDADVLDFTAFVSWANCEVRIAAGLGLDVAPPA